EKTAYQNSLIRDRIYERASDPKRTFVAPKKEMVVPYFNFAPLQNALLQIRQSAEDYEKTFNALLQHPDQGKIHQMNSKVYKSERHLTSEQGLPGRPWFKHLIYAPGYYTGYGVKTLPGVREALEERDFDEVEPEIQ